ncbi:galectin [Anopheles darlingi]|uniref:Galectin n=1 Tax=Anopheles darlingi TaxID=43151 RepID=W5J9I4_ANODA|nr:galectin [Anopheles darlingi]
MLTTFAGTLASPVSVGHIFHFSAKSLDDAERVDIDFQTERSADADVPLHLSVRFEEQRLVVGSKLGGQWVEAERQTPQHDTTSQSALQTLMPGHVFTVYVLVGDSSYHIALADCPIGAFTIRGSLADIKAVTITKDVHQILAVDHRQSFPFPFPAIQMHDETCYFSNDVPKPFVPGHVIILTAVPYGNPRGGFIIKFHENGSRKQALHFNPRFDPHYVVVRNSHASEALDFRQEERTGGFPFIIDQQFTLAIGLAEQEFKFAINGSQFETYAYKAHRQLDTLNGFRVQCTNGLQLEVTAVDHYHSGSPDCAGYEEYSNPYADLLA